MKRPVDLRTLALNWAGATVFAALFFGVAAQLDRDTTMVHEAAAQAREAQLLEAHMARGATALCEAEHGPGARAGWTPDGSLICMAAPVAVAQTAKEQLP